MNRVAAAALRLTGADPGRVGGLATALRAEARGQEDLQYQARGGRGLSPATSRILILSFLGLGSLGLAIGVAVVQDRVLLLGALLAVAQAVAAVTRAAGEVVPLVLGADDHRVLGWWPVSERELLVARGALILGIVLEASAAMLAVPLVVLAVVARPPVLAMLLAVPGFLLHAVALSSLMLLGVHGLGRMLGRARARRTVQVMGGIVAVLVMNVAIHGSERFGGWVTGISPAWLLAMPPVWFGAGLALLRDPLVGAAGLVTGLASTGGLALVGVRVLGRVSRGDEETTVRRRAPRFDWARPLSDLLAPWLRGRDGRALRLLLRAHLREDWRFTSAALFLPGTLLVYMFVVRSDGFQDMEQGLSSAAGAATMVSLWLSLIGVMLGGAVVCSTEAQAAWLVQGSVGDPRRALALQRRLVAGLVGAPMLALVMVMLVWRIGLPWRDVPLVVAPAWLVFESMLVLMQGVVPSASFSRAWRREGNDFRGFHLLVLLAWPLTMGPVAVLYGEGAWGKATVLAVQLTVLGLLHLLLRHRVSRLGLLGFTPRLR